MTNGAPQPLAAAQRCGNCARFSTQSVALAPYGFGRCALKPVWVNMSEQTVCGLSPSQWKQGVSDANL